MKEKIQSAITYFSSSNKRTISLLFIVLLLLAVPFTVITLQQQQNIKQEASQRSGFPCGVSCKDYTCFCPNKGEVCRNGTCVSIPPTASASPILCTTGETCVSKPVQSESVDACVNLALNNLKKDCRNIEGSSVGVKVNAEQKKTPGTIGMWSCTATQTVETCPQTPMPTPIACKSINMPCGGISPNTNACCPGLVCYQTSRNPDATGTCVIAPTIKPTPTPPPTCQKLNMACGGIANTSCCYGLVCKPTSTGPDATGICISYGVTPKPTIICPQFAAPYCPPPGYLVYPTPLTDVNGCPRPPSCIIPTPVPATCGPTNPKYLCPSGQACSYSNGQYVCMSGYTCSGISGGTCPSEQVCIYDSIALTDICKLKSAIFP